MHAVIVRRVFVIHLMFGLTALAAPGDESNIEGRGLAPLPTTAEGAHVKSC